MRAILPLRFPGAYATQPRLRARQYASLPCVKVLTPIEILAAKLANKNE